MPAKKFTSHHNGVIYIGSKDDTAIVTGSVTKGDKKWTLKGHPVINKTEGSYKHGNEVQIILWNKANSTYEQPRVKYAEKWDRLEIFFPPEVWHDLIKQYYQAIKKD